MSMHQTIFVLKSTNWCWYRVRKTKEKHAHKLWHDPYRETWITSLSTFYSWSDDLPNYMRVVVTYCTYAFWFQFHLCICLLFSIRGLISVITSNYRLVDDDFVKTCNFVRVTSISWYILNRQSTSLIYQSSIFCIVQLSPFHFILNFFMIWW